MGIPFFENFTASQYNAHNRNFDVVCDREGHTFFANFEGLLVFDNVEWRVVHTPDISRVVEVSIDDEGNVRFEGVSVTGYVESVDGDSIRVFYTRNDGNAGQSLSGLSGGDESEVDRWNNIEVYQRLRISDSRILLATATDGVIAVDAQGNEIWRVNVDNGLCSNRLQVLLKHPDIAIILSDINMPEMDGLTLLTKINEMRNPSLKCIMVSAYGDMDNIRHAMNNGAFDFATKPIDLDDLQLTIDVLLMSS